MRRTLSCALSFVCASAMALGTVLANIGMAADTGDDVVVLDEHTIR